VEVHDLGICIAYRIACIIGRNWQSIPDFHVKVLTSRYVLLPRGFLDLENTTTTYPTAQHVADASSILHDHKGNLMVKSKYSDLKTYVVYRCLFAFDPFIFTSTVACRYPKPLFSEPIGAYHRTAMLQVTASTSLLALFRAAESFSNTSLVRRMSVLIFLDAREF
jgi:hypothetical protein